MEKDKNKRLQASELKETFLTNSGIPVKRLYTPEDVKDIDYEKDVGEPGEFPYTRGIHPSMYRKRLWTIRQFSGLESAYETNKRYKLLYESGITGFAIAMDNASIMGFDPTSNEAECEVCVGGVSVSSMKDMEIIFEGLPIEKISTAVIQIINTTCPHTAMYLAMAENRGMPLSMINGTTEGDPTSLGGCFDGSFLPVNQMIRLCGDLVEWCAINAPKWNPVSFTSYNYREAGVNAYQEIGGLISSAVAVIEEVLGRDRGLTVDDFVPQFAFHLSAHNDFFEEIAKMRAARKMWAQLMTEKYGAKNPRTKTLRFHVQTAGSTLTYQQPINNAIRAAYQSLAAALGGVQSLHVCSYDEAICNPTEESAILSVRTQQILQNETNIINTVDPLAGSYFVESLTKGIEERAWGFYNELEEQGGWGKAIESGWIQNHKEGEVCKYEQEMRSGEKRVVGVNCYKDDEKTAKISVFRADPELGERLRERLEKLKKERDNVKVDEALAELREADDAGDNVMPAIMKAVKAYATIEEMTDITVRRYPTPGVYNSPAYGLKGVIS